MCQLQDNSYRSRVLGLAPLAAANIHIGIQGGKILVRENFCPEKLSAGKIAPQSLKVMGKIAPHFAMVKGKA